MAANRLRKLWRRSNLLTTRLIRLFVSQENVPPEQAQRPMPPGVAGALPTGGQQAQSMVLAPSIPHRRQCSAMRISECLEGIQPEEVRWLWPGRIPRGKLTILDGDPGLGKSLLSLDIAARVSRGSDFPDGAPRQAGSVVLLNAEDGVADTVVPRLRAAGADLSKVHTIRVIPQPGGDRLPDIITDAAKIEMEVLRLRAVLIVIDPLNCYLPSEVNTWNDHHVRRALAPFAAVADRTGAAVLVIRHLNKRETPNALYRGGGSIGIIAAARAAFLVARHPQDSSLVVFAPVKMNLAAKPLSLAYRVAVTADVARIEWAGPVDLEADGLLAEHQATERPSELNRATEFLRSFLRGGPKLTEQVKSAALQLGISERTLKRAKGAIGVMAEHEGYGTGSKWLWHLGAEGQWPKEGQPTHTVTLAPFDGMARFDSKRDSKLEALLKELGDEEVEIDWDAPEQTGPDFC